MLASKKKADCSVDVEASGLENLREALWVGGGGLIAVSAIGAGAIPAAAAGASATAAYWLVKNVVPSYPSRG